MHFEAFGETKANKNSMFRQFAVFIFPFKLYYLVKIKREQFKNILQSIFKHFRLVIAMLYSNNVSSTFSK